MRSFVLLLALAACAGCSDSEETSDATGSGGAASSSTTSSASTTGGTGGGEAGAGGAGAAGGSGGSAGGGAAAPVPPCSVVQGTAAVTFSLDEGQTLVPTAEPLGGVAYTYGLAALQTPDRLVAEHAGEIILSSDAGCTWSPIGTVATSPLTVASGVGDRAFAFADNGSALYRVDTTTVTKLGVPATSILGLGTDPTDVDRVRIGDSSGNLFESTDGGATWQGIGTPAPVGANPLVYRYAFDPVDFDHILVGAATVGSFVSTDGGATWDASTGLGDGNVNVFSIVISPVDGAVVWAQGIDLDHTGDPIFEGRTIWRSVDGGASFAPVVIQTAEITIRNQELLAAHPADAAVLYFVFGTYYGGYGTDVYRYDDATGSVLTRHNPYDDVNALAFSRANPDVMYLGLTSEEITLGP